jgi:hypothetical protein
MSVIGDVIAGLELVKTLAGLIDRGGSFEMAFDAERVSPLGGELCGVDSGAATVGVSQVRAVAALAGDSTVEEGFAGIQRVRTRDGGCNPLAWQFRQSRYEGRFKGLCRAWV